MTAENHTKFLSHLRHSQEAVQVVARWLSDQGRDVIIKGITYAQSHYDWQDHTDKGDLFVMKRIEVKRLSASFTSLAHTLIA